MWYSASLFFRGNRRENSSAAPLWEESVRLIRAETEDQARGRAEEIGKTEELTYRTNEGAIDWVFERVERVIELEAFPVDGAEVFCRFLRDTEARSLLRPFDDE